MRGAASSNCTLFCIQSHPISPPERNGRWFFSPVLSVIVFFVIIRRYWVHSQDAADPTAVGVEAAVVDAEVETTTQRTPWTRTTSTRKKRKTMAKI